VESVKIGLQAIMGKFDFVGNDGSIVKCNSKEEKQEAISHISSMMDN
jgi:hypothetical protein